MLTILIPCAGEGKRFKEAGYKEPKPLIDVNGKPMLLAVIENVATVPCRVVVVIRNGDLELAEAVRRWKFDYRLVLDIETFTILEDSHGAAETCLMARDRIPQLYPLLIANCDQLVDGGIKPLLEEVGAANVLTHQVLGGDSKWSYASVAQNGLVLRVIEKPKAAHFYTRATTGHYYFHRASDFFAAARCMIEMGDAVNDEFYVAPTLNYLIAAGKPVREVKVESYSTFHGLGTPEDLELYLKRTKS